MVLIPEDDFVLFDLRLRAFMEWLDLQSGLQVSMGAKVK
jgi:hypothetical protein